MTLVPEALVAQRSREWTTYDGSAVEMDTQARLHLDPSCDYSRKRFLYRKSESFELSLMRELVAAGDDVIDVGANVGYWTTAMARAVGPEGRVFAFEPLVRTFRILQRNVEINGFNHVFTFNAALSDHNGEALLTADRSRTGHSHVVPTGRDAGNDTVAVVLNRLDRYETLLRRERVSFLKIDVEGHEVAVLRGAKNLLARTNVAVLAEYSEGGFQRAGYDFADLKATCDELHFNISVILPDDNPSVPAGLLDATAETLPDACNLLLRRASTP